MTSDRAIPFGVSAEALSSMFQAIGGLRNYRAAAGVLACFFVALILISIVAAVGGLGIGGNVLIWLVAMVAGFAGIHASGVLLMDQARGLPGRSIVEAIVYGLLCVPKTIVLIIALVLAALVVYLVMALLFFISKMPGLGPVLFAFTFPVAVLMAGLVFTGLWMGLVLSLAAIWEGETIVGALVKALALLQQRLVEAFLLLVVVFLLSSIVAMLVFGVLLGGFWPAAGLAVSMLDVPLSGLEAVGSMFGGSRFGASSGGGYAVAGLFGLGVLWSLAMTLAMQVGLLGVNLAYLRVSEGVDAGAAEGALQARLADARRKAAEMGQKAKEASERARLQAEQAMAQRRAAAEAAKAAAPALGAPLAGAVAERPEGAAPEPSARTVQAVAACPACQQPVSTEDAFCGSCGHRLKA